MNAAANVSAVAAATAAAATAAATFLLKALNYWQLHATAATKQSRLNGPIASQHTHGQFGQPDSHLWPGHINDQMSISQQSLQQFLCFLVNNFWCPTGGSSNSSDHSNCCRRLGQRCACAEATATAATKPPDLT